MSLSRSFKFLQCAPKPLTNAPLRHFSTGRRLCDEKDDAGEKKKLPPLQLSENESPEVLEKAQRLMEENGWEISDNKLGLQKTFYFLGPKQAMKFYYKITETANAACHHPKWHLNWQPVTISWHTHKPKGFSQKDIDMIEVTEAYAARQAERLVRRLGVQTPEAGDDVPLMKPGQVGVEHSVYVKEEVHKDFKR